LKVSALVLCSLAALALPAASVAAPRTTDPGKDLVVYVNITDRGIKLAAFLRGELAGQPNLFVAQPARGETATFEVRNLGRKPHSFAVLGKRTRILAPGGKARFTVFLMRRGEFPYRSAADKGKRRFRGFFTVL
jgi:hypothetical protein